jgi:hypothetical protein
MPNYVNSTLSVSGSKEDLKNFKEKCASGGKLDANSVIPYPRDLELLDKKNGDRFDGIKLTDEEERELTLIALECKYDMKKDGFNQGGYDWNVANWGTKWGFCDCVVEEEEEDSIMYSFSTAWSPIDKVITKMSEVFPNLLFEYFGDEESGDFRFEAEYKGGIQTSYEDKTYEIEEERLEREAEELEQERDRKMEKI